MAERKAVVETTEPWVVRPMKGAMDKAVASIFSGLLSDDRNSKMVASGFSIAMAASMA